MKTIRQSIWAILGIASIAVVLGYMVGASSTPVVGVVIPIIFGLAVTALGFFSSSSIERKLKEVRELIKENNSLEIPQSLSHFSSDLKKMPNQLGKLLLIFTLFYAFGLMTGTKARINEWFIPVRERQLPWTASGRVPPTAADAVDWIALQEELIHLGYSRGHIDHLYSIQVTEWDRRNTNPSYTAPVASSLPGRLEKVMGLEIKPLQSVMGLKPSTKK
jgi:hypothetical protein